MHRFSHMQILNLRDWSLLQLTRRALGARWTCEPFTVCFPAALKVFFPMMLSSTQSLMDFRRHELLTRSSTSRGCMAVFPQGKKARQRVAVGDSSGAVIVFTIGKHHELQTQFETPGGPKAVTRVTLFEDQLFFTAGPQISAYSKKGKLFFGFESNMTESVRSFQIDTPFIFAGGEYVLTTFKEVNEVGYFMSPDRINEILFHKHRDANVDIPDAKNYHLYLGCNDRILRTVMGNQVVAEAGCEAAITSMAFGIDNRGKDLIYGTSGGSLGAFQITKGDELARKYSLIPDVRLGNITSIASTDINLDGTADVILGREDGSVEVHAMSLHADNAAPLRMWSTNVGEYVTTVCTGMITQAERDEVLVNTFSGKVIAFALSDADVDLSQALPKVMMARALDIPSAQDVIVKAKNVEEKATKVPVAVAAVEVKETKPIDAKFTQSKPVEPAVAPLQTPAPSVSTKAPTDRQTKATAVSSQDQEPSYLEIVHSQVNDLKAEVAKLKQAVEAKRQEYASAAGAQETNRARAVTSEFKIRDSFTLDGAAAVVLSIEADVPIHHVSIQCDIPLEILDSESVVIRCQHSIHREDQETKTLFVLKPAEDRTNRVHATLRAQEGLAGTIKAFVVAEAQPRTAQMRRFLMRPLSLHNRITEGEMDWAVLPLSSLTIQGNFTIRDAHGWLLNTLPEMPEVLASTASANSLYFRNAFQGTVLSVRYTKGEAEFHSDSLTTLSIMKDFLTREATARKIQIRMQYNCRKESVLRHLQLLHPLMGYQVSLLAKRSLLDALKEIETQEQDATMLAPEYKQILADAQKLDDEMKLQPQRLAYLRTIVRQLFKDKSALLGENVSQGKLHELEAVLEQYNEAAVEQFFGVTNLRLLPASVADQYPADMQHGPSDESGATAPPPDEV